MQKKHRSYKIGMILDNVYPPDPRVENEAIELIKKGHTVFLCCLTYKNEIKKEIINGIHVRRYLSNTLEYKLSALAYTISVYAFFMKKKIKDFIIKNKIDIIHIHDMKIAGACFEANKKFNLPVVLDLHENRPEIMRFYPHMQKLYSKFLISIKKWKKKEEEFVKKANKIIVVTKHAKEELIYRTGTASKKIAIVPNTIRTSFYEKNNQKKIPYTKNENDFVLLYLGDTGVRRGLKTVVLSLLKLKQEKNIKNIKFIIVGKISNYLKKIIIENNIQNQVQLYGWQTDTTFPEWIRKADICVSPLHKNIHHDTTYANKIFQYMSFGKALLVSNVVAQEALIKELNAGLVHKERDVNDFTEKLLQLYRNESLRKELGENGKEFVRNHFTWDKTSKELLEIYTTIH